MKKLINKIKKKREKKEKMNMKTLKTDFAFSINGSEFNEVYYENDSNGNVIYAEGSDGYCWRKEFDANGNETYYENSNGIIRGNRNVPEESPEESLRRLIKDKSVLEFCQEFGSASSGATTEIVLDGSIMTDEYYSELIDVINKMQGSTQYTVTIK